MLRDFLAKSGGVGGDIFFLSDWIQDETRSAREGIALYISFTLK
jgi:hypothetical protein